MSAGERLTVAVVRGLHGLRGALRIEVLTDHPETRFRPGATLYREGSDQPLTVASAGPSEPGWLIRFEELADRTAAEALRNAYLEIVTAPDDQLPRGAYYWHDVIGSHVFDVGGRELGVVADVYRAGGAEVFVVRGEPFGEFDVPAVRDFVRIFAPRRSEIVIDADALDLAAPEPKRPRGRRSSREAARPVEGRVPAAPAPSSAGSGNDPERRVSTDGAARPDGPIGSADA